MIVIYLLLTGVLGALPVLFIHEMGHWLVGAFNGFRFKMLFLGPWVIERKEHKLTVNSNNEKATWGGAVALEPKDINAYSRVRAARMILGGPIISIIVGLLLLWICFITRTVWVLTIAGMSLGIGISTLIPFRKAVGLFYNDGRRAYALLKNDTQGQIEERLMYLQMCAMNNMIEEKIPEITKHLEYILSHRLDGDVLYTVMALSYILEHKIPIISKEEALSEMTKIKEQASAMEQNMIDSVMKEVKSS